MNIKSTYELTITRKLEQLTAPDMVDAIWTRIEAQLDSDLPTDEGGPADVPPAPKSGPRKWISRGTMIVAVSAVLTYLVTNRNQTQTTTVKDQPAINAPVTIPDRNDQPARNNSPDINNGIASQQKAGGPATTLTKPVNTDSTATAPPTEPLQLQQVNDDALPTGAAPLNIPPLLSPPNTTLPDSTSKRRGVKGITDNDYKIIPKKDSSMD